MDDSSRDPAAPGQPPAPAKPQPPAPREGIKETIESILVAFILAFVFRAFIVEAFVIPSGSMAPTLLGAHMRFHCEQCAYQFDLNYPGAAQGESIVIPDIAPGDFPVHCPNCGFKARKVERSQPAPPPASNATNPPVYYGDRILVLKYMYLLREPHRWDVVVFKTPARVSGVPDFTQNFIKRLTGLPGETLMLLDGDVYTCPNAAADALRQQAGETWARQAPWQVQPKSDAAQGALWRVIYDNDYHPRAIPGVKSSWTMPWRPADGSGWTTGSLETPLLTLPFDNLSGAGALAFDPKAVSDANPGVYPFTDWLPYNEARDVSASYAINSYDSSVPSWNVSDLLLRFAYQRQAGDGQLRASLTKLGHTFSAVAVPGAIRLLHAPPAGAERQIGQDVPLKGQGPWMIEIQNVDYVVTLRVDGQVAARTTPKDYAPDLADLFTRYDRGKGSPVDARKEFPPPSARIVAERQQCALSHLSLWRDIYYTPSQGIRLVHASPENPIRLGTAGEPQVDAAGNPLPPRDDEYFVLGDNSILSGDARGWRDPVDLVGTQKLYTDDGRVPGRFLLGKAFFVYWPAGFRPFSSTAPGIVPNFGEMRFIH